jgi:hypothetical protein
MSLEGINKGLMIDMITYYLVREQQTEEAKALFFLPHFNYPFLWFGIQTVEKISNREVPTSFKVMGCSHSPKEQRAQQHKMYGSVHLGRQQYDMIGSFDWAERISEAQFETYYEMAGLPLLELDSTEHL